MRAGTHQRSHRPIRGQPRHEIVSQRARISRTGARTQPAAREGSRGQPAKELQDAQRGGPGAAATAKGRCAAVRGGSRLFADVRKAGCGGEFISPGLSGALKTASEALGGDDSAAVARGNSASPPSTSDPEGASVRARRRRTEASCLHWMRWWGREGERARARLPSRAVTARRAALAVARTAYSVPSGEIPSPAFPSGLVGDKPVMDVTAEESLGGLAVSKGCIVLGKL